MKNIIPVKHREWIGERQYGSRDVSCWDGLDYSEGGGDKKKRAYLRDGIQILADRWE